MVKYLSFIIFLLFMFVRGLRKERLNTCSEASKDSHGDKVLNLNLLGI